MRKMGLFLILDSCCARGRRVGNAYFHVRVDGNRVHAIAPWSHYIRIRLLCLSFSSPSVKYSNPDGGSRIQCFVNRRNPSEIRKPVTLVSLGTQCV